MSPCVGCKRDRFSGRCFLVPIAKVRWALLEHRGCWCADCHALWRTMRSGQHALSFFAQWLKHADNYHAWQLEQVAFLALRMAGAQHIRAPQFQARIEALRRMAGWLGIPLEPMMVRPLDEMLADVASFQSIAISRLNTVRTGCADSLGVLMPLADAHPDRAIARPMSDIDGQQLLLQQLSVTRAVHRSLLSGSAASAEQETAVVPVTGNIDAHPQLSKMHMKLNSLISEVSSGLQRFTDCSWETKYKESMLTKPQDKFNTLNIEAKACGDTQVSDESETWGVAIQHGKLMLNIFRDDWKTRARHSKCMQLSPRMPIFVDFLKKKLQSVAPSLELMNIRLLFLEAVHKEPKSRLGISLGPAPQETHWLWLAGTFQAVRVRDNPSECIA